MNSNKSIEAVKSNDLFKGLDFASLNIPFDTKNFLEFKEGDLIYSSGQPSNFVYLLINGEVKVKLNSIKRLFFKSPNEFFGETEVMQKEQRSSSALANSDCLIYKIDESLVSKLL
ncbi:MAG: cyclic nucleotide-binding domain-containing protein, partial [Ignavibacterium sp.]|nr:cyclic nucleotide-binding domain-containing protein [Ignavibacterium sp.]